MKPRGLAISLVMFAALAVSIGPPLALTGCTPAAKQEVKSAAEFAPAACADVEILLKDPDLGQVCTTADEIDKVLLGSGVLGAKKSGPVTNADLMRAIAARRKDGAK